MNLVHIHLANMEKLAGFSPFGNRFSFTPGQRVKLKKDIVEAIKSVEGDDPRSGLPKELLSLQDKETFVKEVRKEGYILVEGVSKTTSIDFFRPAGKMERGDVDGN